MESCGDQKLRIQLHQGSVRHRKMIEESTNAITFDNKIHGSLPNFEIAIASNWNSFTRHEDNIVTVSADLLTFRSLSIIICAPSPDTR